MVPQPSSHAATQSWQSWQARQARQASQANKRPREAGDTRESGEAGEAGEACEASQSVQAGHAGQAGSQAANQPGRQASSHAGRQPGSLSARQASAARRVAGMPRTASLFVPASALRPLSAMGGLLLLARICSLRELEPRFGPLFLCFLSLAPTPSRRLGLSPHRDGMHGLVIMDAAPGRGYADPTSHIQIIIQHPRGKELQTPWGMDPPGSSCSPHHGDAHLSSSSSESSAVAPWHGRPWTDPGR